MWLPVVLRTIVVKAPEPADSDKASGHPRPQPIFLQTKEAGDKKVDVSLMTPSSAPCELILLRSHRYKLIKINRFLFRNDKVTLTFFFMHT